MKKRHALIVIMIAWLPMFIAAWNAAKPAATTTLRSSNPEILANNTALESAIGQDHEFSTGGTNTGKHLQVTFDDPLGAAPATVAASELVLYTLDVGGKAELHVEDEDENTLQMTSGGDLYSSTGLTVTTNATFNGGITLGAGDDLIGSATSDITFNTNKFTVAGATGNTLVAGTLDVQGNIDPTTYETTNGGFLDEDAMGSDAADKVASQQSIKKYVDDNTTMVPAVTGAGTGYGGEESITFANGIIFKHGTESVATDTTDDVTYGTAFPTAFITAFATYKTNHTALDEACCAKAKTGSTTSILEVTNGDTSTREIYWQAWGY